MESHNPVDEGEYLSAPDSPRLHPVTDGADLAPVVFIAGMGRSGSTLLDRLLGQIEGWWSLGEIVHLWTRGLTDNERCGCGEHFLDCEVWTEIGDVAFGGWDQIDASAVNELRLKVERDRFIPLLLRPGLRPGFMTDALAYTGIVSRVYEAARQVSGAKVIVDSGKHVPAALLLRLDPELDLRVLHLVRDSRGVAYSWNKSVRRPATDGTTNMARWSPLEAALRYVGYNSVLAAVFGGSRLTVRYEDLVSDTPQVLARILEWVGIGSMDFQPDAGAVRLRTSHGISGNPMRFAVGEIGLRVDDEWTSGLTAWERRLVTAITLPSLIQNRYSIAPRRRGS